PKNFQDEFFFISFSSLISNIFIEIFNFSFFLHSLTIRSGSGSSGLEDMKQRLRFLSRRHTDSSLHASTVRPSRDEVEKWSKSFRDLMANRCTFFLNFIL
ncbi:hypothetical protein BLA29_013920, partial [Euroglyphus maynei]